jgi:DNA-binding transcriptional LysR family regulator
VALQSRVAVQLELDLGLLESIRPRGGLPERSWFVVWSAAGPAREPVEAFTEYVQSAAARRALASG